MALGLCGNGILPLDITIYHGECSIRVADCTIRVF